MKRRLWYWLYDLLERTSYWIYQHKVLLLLVAVPLWVQAQTVPPQFEKLHTTPDDYTCGGTVPCATWPMPPLPAVGASWSDATFGTTTWRLAAPLTNQEAMSTYSRVQAWNTDGSRMFLTDYAGYAILYDSSQTPPKYINRITPDVGLMLPVSLDVLWSNTDPHKIFYVPNRSSGHGLELRSVDVSACTAQACGLVSTLVHTFSCMSDATGGDIPAGVPGNQIETGSGAQGGMFDATDRYFSFSCDAVDGTGRHEIDFIRYDRQSDQVTHQDKWYKVCPGQVPTGCGTWATTGLRRNLFRMNQHPDARFITVIWQGGARDANWTRGLGVEAFDPNYNYLGVALPYPGHQDNGYDINGVPVFVGIASYRNDLNDERAISVVDLTKVAPDHQTYKRYLMPCSYARQPSCSGTSLTGKHGASHISMTAWNLPGYGLVSTMIMAGPAYGTAPQYPPGTALGTAVQPGEATVTPASMAQIAAGVVSTVDAKPAMESVTWTAATGSMATATFAAAHSSAADVRCLSCGDTGFGAMENFAVRIDARDVDNSDIKFWRIGRTMAIRDGDYNAEPHTAVNRDFTQLVWGSTWNVDPGSNGATFAFWTRLGEAIPIPPQPEPCPCVQRAVDGWTWKIVILVGLVIWLPILMASGAWLWWHRRRRP